MNIITTTERSANTRAKRFKNYETQINDEIEASGYDCITLNLYDVDESDRGDIRKELETAGYQIKEFRTIHDDEDYLYIVMIDPANV